MRIKGYGLVDRDTPVRFHFDGRPVSGFAGDTVASALLANGIRLMGRSFKYHRPRGVMTAGPEEPNALIEVGSGAARLPNIRATVQDLYPGLETHSQNHLGPLSHDLLAINDLAAPFLGAGFYYKTFMWPRSFWEKLYEPLIRRAAGLGRIVPQASPRDSEKAFAHCDILVIGGGPAGLMAALCAARSGADVILAEDSPHLGGRVLSDGEEIDGMPARDWIATIEAELAETGRVRILRRTTITGLYDGLTFGAVERVGHHRPAAPGLPLDCFWRITAAQAVLASGALERPIAFPMNDRPGVMLGASIRTYLNRFGVSPGAQVSLFTSTDDGHRTAAQLIAAGVEVAAVIDARHHVEKQGSYRLIEGAEVISTKGRKGLSAVKLRQGSSEFWLESDCLGVSGGWNPTLHLTCHLGARPVWNDQIAGFVPAHGAVPGLYPAGAVTGAFSTHDALSQGVEAAAEALRALGLKAKRPNLPKSDHDPGSGIAVWTIEAKGRAWLDFANDVTTKDVAQSAAEGMTSVEHMKRYTTQGMAPDQGKSSNIGALAVLADATGRAIPETGTTTYRPPFAPVPLAAMGAGARGMGFAPQRLTPSHAALTARGVPMVEAGLWYRPSYVPLPGERTWREACDREVTMVRNSVGVVDVSTLGKIEIFGPDAGAFLDFVYTNTFSTLKPGRVRYGVMLREDGHVMDDGTTACLAEGHYVMTTTTAAAGAVMTHLEFVAQALRPDLDVRLTSTTEHWAQFAVAGPRARELLNGVLDEAIDDTTFPYMACGAVDVHGIKGRLFRISFSGEHAYEIAVPAQYGDALYRDLVARAEALGGGAYGMEALNVMRIEKGFVTHAEIHGRVTAHDCGMGRVVSTKKDFIGKAAATRPGLSDPARERLVGLRPAGAVTQMTAGAHLFNRGDAATRVNDQGYITSVAYSPSLGHFIALGFVARGPERLGEVLTMVDHLRGITAEVEICDPVFFDKNGGRLRG